MLASRIPMFWLLGTLASILVQMALSQSPQETSVPCSMELQGQGCLNCTRAAGSGTAMICTSCGAFKFYNQTTQSCQDCFSGCADCSSRASCEKCTFGYFVTPANQTRQQLGYRHTCTACMVQNCLNCTDETTCNFCSVGYTRDPESPGTCKYRVEEWVGTAKELAWEVTLGVLVICLFVAGGSVVWFYLEKRRSSAYLKALDEARRRRENSRIPPNSEESDTHFRQNTNQLEEFPTKTIDGDSQDKLFGKPVLPVDQLEAKPAKFSLEVEVATQLRGPTKVTSLGGLDHSDL